MSEQGEGEDEETQMVGARIPISKKKRIEETMAYRDTMQEWLEDAIDRKLQALEAGEEGNPSPSQAVTAD